MTQPVHNEWFAEAIKNARASALPILVENLFVNDDLDVDTLMDAIELALLSITGNVTEENGRDALRMLCVEYADDIGVPWTTLADAILGTLQWTKPDPSKWTLQTWK